MQAPLDSKCNFLIFILLHSFLSEPCFAIIVPSEELGRHFSLAPICSAFWVQHEGSWMGPGPFAVWQMVDYPNKRTNYLGFPSAPGHC